MRFGDAQAFWFLLMVPLCILFYIRAFRRRRRALADFGSPALMVKLTSATSWARQAIKAALVVAGLFFLVIALVQPQFGTKLELLRRRGVDIVVALDTSLSMLAEDIKPNRLTRALYEIEALILGGLELEPRDRPNSMAALAADLRSVAADEPIRYRRPPLWRRAQLTYRRNRRALHLTAVAGPRLRARLADRHRRRAGRRGPRRGFPACI